MRYTVEFSLEAAAELLRIVGFIGSAELVIRAADTIRSRLASEPAAVGTFLSEGLYYVDEEPLRAFFLIDAESLIVEVTDFRVL